ncbi:class I SAM-dependent RNA methyltransferase [Corynebacterium sp. sy017]|uniref:class I SAM-dependent RNA methyltransferase n=1 Tax=unclassified Corynebacterium TaxID=2624378 RepID=UPI0011872C22|nr:MULTISPECIES: TRAM domain-containing protein [unclassified Corynebacterium]MBP3087748.1 class I SAM-dependent RNA methyltransferase [Corynebacterium sp. sy017]TSD92299.1 class I SAM-dependent RNA methyltransferase [Corynebacterium sp. SY003]
MTTYEKGTRHTLRIERMAHGGEGIGLLDGQVVFVKSAFPGDEVLVEITQKKKNFARARLLNIEVPSALRTKHRCEAAQHGGGCCDLSAVKPEKELELKEQILRDQLSRLAQIDPLPPISVHDFGLTTQWRTRMRLGTDTQGRAGVRLVHSREVVTDYPCSQAVPGLLDDITSYRFTPGSEVIVVVDDEGQRSIVEISKAPRGRRSEKITKVIAGSDTVVQCVGDEEERNFTIPATAFWQAHKNATTAYTHQIKQWISTWCEQKQHSNHLVAWDLYGGVGAFVPGILDAVDTAVSVHSVEASAQSVRAGESAFEEEGDDNSHVVFHSMPVEQALGQLPSPDIVISDPPRVGAGDHVVSAIAAASPQLAIHIGCDPATFARDLKAWIAGGYRVCEIVLFNAFPATHHFECLALIEPGTQQD